MKKRNTVDRDCPVLFSIMLQSGCPLFLCLIRNSGILTEIVSVLCCNLAALCSSVSLAILASWDSLSCCNLAVRCVFVSDACSCCLDLLCIYNRGCFFSGVSVFFFSCRLLSFYIIDLDVVLLSQKHV